VAAKGIVFDMRGYPRVNTPMVLAHLSDNVIYSAHFRSPLLTLPDRADMRFIEGGWTLQPLAPRIKARVAFLTGGGAISYAESTMGVVEENALGEIVGEPSAGTNGNVNPLTLPGGYNVAWTGMLVTKRNGTPHHGVGIKPTVPVSPTLAGFRAGRDEVLDRAVQLVGGTPLVP
jgi:C-terminal processing protease CtpA/Prc